MADTLLAGSIGRLAAASSITTATDKIPIYQNGELNYVTPTQLAATPAPGAFTTIVASSTVTATGGLIETVTAGTTAATISNNGLTTFGSESTAATTYTLAAPVAGIRKSLLCNSTSTLAKTLSSGSSLVRFGASSTITNLVFDSANEAVILQGVSATQWAVVSNVGSVSLTS